MRALHCVCHIDVDVFGALLFSIVPSVVLRLVVRRRCWWSCCVTVVRRFVVEVFAVLRFCFITVLDSTLHRHVCVGGILLSCFFDFHRCRSLVLSTVAGFEADLCHWLFGSRPRYMRLVKGWLFLRCVFNEAPAGLCFPPCGVCDVVYYPCSDTIFKSLRLLGRLFRFT